MSVAAEPDAVLDIPALVRPFPNAEAPGGVPLDLLKHVDPATDKETGQLKTELTRLREGSKDAAPDFRTVISLATDALTGKSKDLELVARLVEAATKVHKTAGLRDGLRLMHRVVIDCWEWVHPVSPGARGKRMQLLNSNSSGWKFPQTVHALPLIDCGTETFSHADTLDPARNAILEGAVAACNPDALRAAHADLTAAAAALRELSRELNERLKEDAPYPALTGPITDGMNLGVAIQNCLRTVEAAAQKRGVTLGETPKPDAAAGGTAGGTAGAPQPAPPPPPPPAAETREGLYGQLGRIAAALKKIEPHSPVPYLLERCVKLGQMPFPDLMKAVIKEAATLTELDRLLGLDKKG